MAKEEKNTAIHIAYDDVEPYDPTVPEKNLLRAILFTAMNDLKKSGDSNRKAKEYFLDPSDEYIFSFQSVCNFLSIDPLRVLYFVGLKQKEQDPDICRRAVQ